MTEQKNHLISEVLFVGRAGCEWTQRALNFLTAMGIQPTAVFSKSRGEEFPVSLAELWKGDLIISYRTHFIIPQKILEKSKFGGINVHTGSPSFPGSGAVNWALYEGASNFGITIHETRNAVDAGEIKKIYSFEIYAFDNFDTLSDRSDSQSYLAFCDFFKEYLNSKNNDEIPKIEARWARKARKINELDRLESIDPSVPKDELERIIRATVSENRAPYIQLYGYIFKLIN